MTVTRSTPVVIVTVFDKQYVSTLVADSWEAASIAVQQFMQSRHGIMPRVTWAHDTTSNYLFASFFESRYESTAYYFAAHEQEVVTCNGKQHSM